MQRKVKLTIYNCLNTGATSCQPCAPGSFQSETGRSSCDACLMGTYTDNTGYKKCINCPYRLSSYNSSQTCSICNAEFYLNDVAPLLMKNDLSLIFENPSRYCLACPDGSSCDDAGMNLTDLTVREGFWRHSTKTATLYKCTRSNACVVSSTTRRSRKDMMMSDDTDNTDTYNMYCDVGHKGPLCEVCIESDYYFNDNDGECRQCPSPINIALLTIGILVAVVVVFILLRYMIMYDKMSRYLYLFSSLSIRAKAKLLVSFYQVVASLNDVYGVSLSSRFTSVVNIFGYLSFDLFQIIGISLNCIGSIQLQFLLKVLWPYMLVTLGLSLGIVYKTCSNAKELKNSILVHLKNWTIQYIIIVFYFALPMVARGIFDAKKCRAFKDDDEKGEFISYLLVDMSIICDANEDSDYSVIEILFWVFFVVWIVITPLAFWTLLWFISPSIRSNKVTFLTNASRFLWEDYHPSMWFWDIVDTYRKVFLTGFIMFIDPKEGSNKLLRLVVAIVVSILFTVILLGFHPYKRKDDYYFALLTNLLLLWSLSLGVVLKLCNNYESDDENIGKNIDQMNVCETFIGTSLDSYNTSVLVVALAVGLLVFTVCLLIILVVNKAKEPFVSMVTTGYPPNLELPPECNFHVFMSHIWSTGQSRTHAIARKLQLLLPGLKVWLDVDELRDLADLETSVEESAVFILFYSKNYFSSKNCRREIFAALNLDKPIVVVFEGDDNVIEEMQNECIKYCDSSIKPTSSEILEKLLEGEGPIQWLNEGCFSAAALKCIYLRMLHHLPYYQKHLVELQKGIIVPGKAKDVSFDSEVTVLTYEKNQGSLDVGKEVQDMMMKGESSASPQHVILKDVMSFLGNTNNTTSATGEEEVPQSPSSNDNSNNKHQDDLSIQLGNDSDKAVYFLLYLNEYTFSGDDHERNELVDVVTSCLNDPNINIILVHERDRSKGSCSFDVLIQQAPTQLIDGEPYSLFKDIAIPLHSERNSYREISLKEIARKMGAK